MSLLPAPPAWSVTGTIVGGLPDWSSVIAPLYVPGFKPVCMTVICSFAGVVTGKGDTDNQPPEEVADGVKDIAWSATAWALVTESVCVGRIVAPGWPKNVRPDGFTTKSLPGEPDPTLN